MTLEDLKQVQKIDTEILFNVIDICERHDIEYYLMYGTLLGAVRHKGPIPWDDDVDIGMTRSNCDKFLKVAKEELDPRNEIKIMGSGNVNYTFELKIGRKGTVYCMPGTEKFDIMNRVQLDIFVLDDLKSCSPFKDKFISLLRIISLNNDEKRLLRLSILKSKKIFKWVYILGLGLLHAIRAILTEEGIERWIYNMLVLREGTSEHIGWALSIKDSFWRKVDFGHPIKTLYAGRMCCVPENPDAVLTRSYGSTYMQFPPEEKRLRNHFDEWIFRYEEYTQMF